MHKNHLNSLFCSTAEQDGLILGKDNKIFLVNDSINRSLTEQTKLKLAHKYKENLDVFIEKNFKGKNAILTEADEKSLFEYQEIGKQETKIFSKRDLKKFMKEREYDLVPDPKDCFVWLKFRLLLGEQIKGEKDQNMRIEKKKTKNTSQEYRIRSESRTSINKGNLVKSRKKGKKLSFNNNIEPKKLALRASPPERLQTISIKNNGKKCQFEDIKKLPKISKKSEKVNIFDVYNMKNKKASLVEVLNRLQLKANILMPGSVITGSRADSGSMKSGSKKTDLEGSEGSPNSQINRRSTGMRRSKFFVQKNFLRKTSTDDDRSSSRYGQGGILEKSNVNRNLSLPGISKDYGKPGSRRMAGKSGFTFERRRRRKLVKKRFNSFGTEGKRGWA